MRNINEHEKVSIRARGNPLPFAVGISLSSWNKIMMNGLRGKAMNVLHCYGDFLWNYASGVPSNDGFSRSVIYPIYNYQQDESLEINHNIEYANLPSELTTESSEAIDIYPITSEVTSLENTSENTIGSGQAQLLEENQINSDSPSIHTVGSETLDFESISINAPQEDDVDNMLVAALPQDSHDRRVSVEADDVDDEYANDDITSSSEQPTSEEISYSSHMGGADTLKSSTNDASSENAASSTTNMDSMLMDAMLKLLKYVVKDSLLPLLVSTLWSLVLRCVV